MVISRSCPKLMASGSSAEQPRPAEQMVSFWPGVAAMTCQSYPARAQRKGSLPHGVAVHAHRVLAAGPETHVAGDRPQEFIRVEVPAEPVDVGAVLPQ